MRYKITVESFISSNPAMPEMPEVETVRLTLLPYVVGNPITKVQILNDKIIRGEKNFQTKLIGQSFTTINRRAKLLSFPLSPSGLYLCAHLKMTGQLMYSHQDILEGGGHSLSSADYDLPNKHTRAIFTFQNNGKLFFNDLRLFAYLKIIDKETLQNTYNKYGIEPGLPHFTLENFQKAFTHSTRSLKSLLLDQSKIAGLGNIYADEICYEASIKPMRKVSDLSSVNIKKLYQVCQTIITKAIKHCGTTFQHFKILNHGQIQNGNFSDYLQVFRRQGQTCKRCGPNYLIKKVKFAGRGTHFCDHCQR